MFVFSVIWINSIEIIGGRSMGAFAKKGKLNVAIIIIIKWKPDEIIIFLVTFTIFLYKAQKLMQLL